MSDDEPLLCARCLKMLQPGQGEFYVVKIDAVADPTPPEITADDLRRDSRREWREILAALADVSSQEALDQVYRHVVIHLCNACFRDWIENPAQTR